MVCAFERWPLLISVCAKLHNYIIDEEGGKAADIPHDLYEEDVRPQDNNIMVLNEEAGNLSPETIQQIIHGGRNVRNAHAGDRRRHMTEMLECRGRRRLAFAQMNSRE